MTTMLVPALLLGDDFGTAAGGAAILGMGLVMMLIMMAVMAVFIISLWKIFTKAGKPGWAALVPIYQVIVLLEIVGRPLWWIVLFCIPFVNIAMVVLIAIDLAKSFGQSAGFAVLLFLGVGYLMLGFGKYKYVGPAGAGSQLARSAAA